MVKKIYLSIVFLAFLSSPALLAGEDYMPMHPGDGSFNEVGIGMAVSPIRRATSEDGPAPSRRPERPLHKNKVTLKLPAPPNLGESRLRIVDVTGNDDGSLDFNLEGAPLLDNNMDIPGLVSPEQLAMDKFNQLEADSLRRQDESFVRNERPNARPPTTGWSGDQYGSESEYAAATSPMQRIGPSSFPDPEELPPSRRIILNPASGAVRADRPETALRVTLPPPIRPSEEPTAAFASKPAGAAALTPTPPDTPPQPAQSLRPPATARDSVQPPADAIRLRPGEFEPATAAVPVPEPTIQDVPDESFFASPPEMTATPIAPAYAAGPPQLPQPMETRYSQPYSAEPVRSGYEKQALMAYEAPARAVPAARDLRDYNSSRPVAEVHAAKPVIRAYEVPMPPAPPASRENPEHDGPRMDSGMAAARSSMGGNEALAYDYDAPLPEPRKREPAAREERVVQERPESIPGAGASKRSPRFRRNVARFDTHAQTETPNASAMRDLKTTLDPIYRQGQR